MNASRLITVLITIILLGSILEAHESWIDIEVQKKPGMEGHIKIKIGNGHGFPKSDMALTDTVINSCKVINPSGKIYQIDTHADGSYRIGYAPATMEGIYLIVAGLKNPPRYFLKSISVIGACSNRPLGAGESMEIVPEQCPASLSVGNKLTLRVYINGAPVPAPLTFSINGKNNFSTSTNTAGEYSLKIPRKGKYLITSSLTGRECSLLFEIP